MTASPSTSRLSRQVPVHEVCQVSVSTEQAFTAEVTVDLDTFDRRTNTDRFTLYSLGDIAGLLAIGVTAEAEVDVLLVLGAATTEDTFEAEAWIEHAPEGGEYTEVTNSRKPTGDE